MYNKKYSNMKINKVTYDDIFKTGLNIYLSKIDEKGELINKKIRYNLLKADYKFNYYYDNEQEYRMRSIFYDEFNYYNIHLKFEDAKKLIGKSGFTIYEYKNICTLLPLKEFMPILENEIGQSCELYIYRIVDYKYKYSILGVDNNGYYRKIDLKYTRYDKLSLSNIRDDKMKDRKKERINKNLCIDIDNMKKTEFENTTVCHYNVNIKSKLYVKGFNKDGIIIPWLDFKKI